MVRVLVPPKRSLSSWELIPKLKLIETISLAIFICIWNVILAMSYAEPLFQLITVTVTTVVMHRPYIDFWAARVDSTYDTKNITQYIYITIRVLSIPYLYSCSMSLMTKPHSSWAEREEAWTSANHSHTNSDVSKDLVSARAKGIMGPYKKTHLEFVKPLGGDAAWISFLGSRDGFRETIALFP